MKYHVHMKDFENLLAVADRLLGPNGCPWDLEQTLTTMQPYLLEEAHELIQAIDTQDPEKIIEELGDCLYVLIFAAKIGEKEGRFNIQDSLKTVTEKLIRRHPHVFGSAKITSTDDVLKNWETIKKQEGKINPFTDIPPTLPALARAQKVIHKLKRLKSPIAKEKLTDGIEQRLWDLVIEAEEEGIDIESSLRRLTRCYEQNAGDGPMA